MSVASTAGAAGGVAAAPAPASAFATAASPSNTSAAAGAASTLHPPASAAPAASPHKHRPIPQLLHLKGTKKRLVIALVGLPARGKTYLARKLCRYLNWIGYSCASFNIGAYRRQLVGAAQPPSFFDPSNAAGVEQREELARAALRDMFSFLADGAGHVAIYDGTNSTVARRAMVSAYVDEQARARDLDIQLMWIEQVCTDPAAVEANILEAKLTSPDSAGLDEEQALSQFRARIAHYESTYESLGASDAELAQSYLTNIDCGRRVVLNRVEGYLVSKIAFFVANLKVNRAPIYITRHGESAHNVLGLIGGDPYLSPNGVKYAEALRHFIASEKEFSRDELEELSVWTSTLKRTLQTAEQLKPLGLPTTHWRALVEIQVGHMDNMTYEQIEQKYPEEFAARKKDKLHYRYPQGGESYMDVIARIEPCILELERMSTPVLLVVHRAVARCFYSYYLDLPQQEIPHLDVPLHTVLKLVPKAYGCSVTRFRIPVESCEDAQAASPPPSEAELAASLRAAQEARAPGATVSTAQQEQSRETIVHVAPPPMLSSQPPVAQPAKL